MEVKLLKLSPKAYESYKRTTRDNENITYDQALRKLSRNVQLVKESYPETIHGLFSKTYPYGKLYIKVKHGTIVSVENRREVQTSFYKNRQRYDELSREYGVIE